MAYSPKHSTEIELLPIITCQHAADFFPVQTSRPEGIPNPFGSLGHIIGLTGRDVGATPRGCPGNADYSRLNLVI
jgi:hypothetical protein